VNISNQIACKDKLTRYRNAPQNQAGQTQGNKQSTVHTRHQDALCVFDQKGGKSP
jgi:hypothetical protein